MLKAKADMYLNQAWELHEHEDMELMKSFLQRKMDEEECDALELAAAMLKYQVGDKGEEIQADSYRSGRGRQGEQNGRGRRDDRAGFGGRGRRGDSEGRGRRNDGDGRDRRRERDRQGGRDSRENRGRQSDRQNDRGGRGRWEPAFGYGTSRRRKEKNSDRRSDS